MKSRDPREFLLRVLGRLFTRWPFQTPTTRATFAETLGTLSNDDNDVSANITLKNEVSSFQTLSRVFGTRQFVKCRRLFLELKS